MVGITMEQTTNKMVATNNDNAQYNWITIHNEQQFKWLMLGTQWTMLYSNNELWNNELRNNANNNNIMGTITIRNVTMHNDYN